MQAERYNFTDKERVYLLPLMDAMDRLAAQMKGALDLIIAQNDLTGQWDLMPDRSGIQPKPGAPNA